MERIVRTVTWVDPQDCDPPHGLDLSLARHANKVNALIEAFAINGFDQNHSALVGYPLNGRIQLLSGTHRHTAAVATKIKLPVTLWLRSNVEETWGELQEWMKVMKDIPVKDLLAVKLEG